MNEKRQQQAHETDHRALYSKDKNRAIARYVIETKSR
jgi:hypothetical protein